MSISGQYNQQGFVLLPSFFERAVVSRVRDDAKGVFLEQGKRLGLVANSHPTEAQFEDMMRRLFTLDNAAFINCGKVCQHLVSLHRLALSEAILDVLRELGIERPVICTRPVIYFNSRHLAKSEVHYKTPPHQDWRSMQGSLNAIVVWVPLVDVSSSLGALEVLPQSHLAGLLDSEPDEWYRRLSGTDTGEYLSVDVKAGDALFFSAFLVHRSGDNVTDAIRWSCHFRYNDLCESHYITRKYPCPYIYKPQQELITPGFPSVGEVGDVFYQRREAS